MSIETFQKTQIMINQFASLHNERVAKYFRPSNKDQSEVAKQRQFLSSVLRIDPTKDSQLDCLFKSQFFNEVCGYAFSNLAPVYGFPVLQFQSETAFKPQIMVRFREREINKQDLPLRKYRLEKEMCFRLKADKIPKNNIQLRALANTCKRIFFPAGRAFNYTSGSAQGSTVWRYRDENGYRLAIDANTKQTAIKLIDSLLDVQGLKFDESKMTATKFTKEKPSKITVYTGRVDKPLRGRWGKLYLYQIEYKQVGTADRILVNGNGVVQV
jgi:hypothetical protein